MAAMPTEDTHHFVVVAIPKTDQHHGARWWSDVIAGIMEAKAADFRAHSQVRAIAGGVSARPIAVHNRFIQKQVSRPDLLPRLDDLQKVINDIRNTLSEPLEEDHE